MPYEKYCCIDKFYYSDLTVTPTNSSISFEDSLSLPQLRSTPKPIAPDPWLIIYA